eukprot:6213059-Pleurochrysis_carterae.AAC.10
MIAASTSAPHLPVARSGRTTVPLGHSTPDSINLLLSSAPNTLADRTGRRAWWPLGEQTTTL